MPAAFPKIKSIRFEGPDSRNPLAFKHYNPTELVEGKSMKEHLRFSVVYWHTMRGMGADMFGSGTMQRPWEDGTNSLAMALKRVPVMFEFCEKLGAPFYAFHDRDVAPEGKPRSRESHKNLDAVVGKVLKEEQQNATGVKLLVGHRLNLFSEPALHARRRHEPVTPRCLRLRRGAGEEGDRGDLHAQLVRRGLRRSGAAAKATPVPAGTPT